MQNSMVVLTFSVFDRKYPLWENLVQNIKIVSSRWNSSLKLIQIWRIQWWCSLFLFLCGILFLGKFGPAIKIISWSWNLEPTPIRISRIQWWCLLFLFLIKNTLFGLIFGQGRWVEDFLVLPQGFGNFPSVFFCSRCNWIVGSSIYILADLIWFHYRTAIKYTINFNY